MDYNELIKNRQSIRKYKEQEIPKEDVEKIIDAARIAPSGKNCQNWYFLAVKNKELIQKLVDTIYKANQVIVGKMAEVDQEKANRFEKFCKHFTLFIESAPAVVLTFAKNYYPSGYFEKKLCGESEEELYELLTKTNPGMQSIGAAMEHMALQAADMNYGSCWLTSANFAADDIEEMLKKEIGFEKEDYFFAGMMSFGVPADVEHKSPGRKPIEEIYMLVE